jgi:hypothetical protein
MCACRCQPNLHSTGVDDPTSSPYKQDQINWLNWGGDLNSPCSKHQYFRVSVIIQTTPPKSRIIQLPHIQNIIQTTLVHRPRFWISLLSSQLPINTSNTPSTVVLSSTVIRMNSPTRLARQSRSPALVQCPLHAVGALVPLTVGQELNSFQDFKAVVYEWAINSNHSVCLQKSDRRSRFRARFIML